MNRKPIIRSMAYVLALLALAGAGPTFSAPTGDQTVDPLPSWNDGKAKLSIIEFVAKVTEEGSSDFVPPEERIATFDNDGTLWAEQPMYFQLLFAIDRLREMAKADPDTRVRLEPIMEATRRGASLVKQLLAFSRREVVAPQVINFGAVVRELEPMLRSLLGSGSSPRPHPAAARAATTTAASTGSTATRGIPCPGSTAPT